VAAAPPAMRVEAIPDPSVEGPRVDDEASMAAAPTPLEILISLLDSSASDRGKGEADVDEVGPSRWLEVPVLERIMLFPNNEVSSGIVRVGRDPFEWGGPRLSWLDKDNEPMFVLNDREEHEMWSEFQIMVWVRGSSILYGDVFLFIGRVLMVSTFFSVSHGQVHGQVRLPSPRVRHLGHAAAPEGLA
jgi:hypothetical protein